MEEFRYYLQDVMGWIMEFSPVWAILIVFLRLG